MSASSGRPKRQGRAMRRLLAGGAVSRDLGQRPLARGFSPAGGAEVGAHLVVASARI